MFRLFAATSCTSW